MEFLHVALALARMGFRVHPLKPNTKDALLTGWPVKATRDERIIQGWAKRYPSSNVGILMGDGLVGIDVDLYKGADADWLQLPPTLTAITASGGLHHIYRYAGELPILNEGILAPHVCVKAGVEGKRSYLVGAGSEINGESYTWVDETQPIVDMPERLAHLIRTAAAPKLVDVKRAEALDAPALRSVKHTDTGAKFLADAMAKTSDGTGDVTGYWLAQQLLIAQKNGDDVDVDAVLSEYAWRATVNPADPFDERSVQKWKRSASASTIVARGEPARSAKPAPLQKRRENITDNSQPITDGSSALAPSPTPVRKKYPLSEFGNAERLLDTYGVGIRYNKAFGFVVWDGKRWRTDDELSVRGYAKATVRDIYKEASQLAMRASGATDEEERKTLSHEAESLMKWARSSETNHMVMSMTALIKNACQLETNCFDNQPWLFNCENGTLDLQTGKMHPHRQEDYLTQIAPVAFDPDAECPIFEAFLDQIMCGRDDLVDYLRRAFGYCLTGHVSEQVWHLLVGTDGENGKSTLIEALLYVLGNYGDTVEPETISIGGMQRDANAPSPDIARLKGRRFVAISETEEGARLAPAKLKKLSGDRYLTARFMRKDIFTFMPSFKMFVHTNHKPQARETTHAFWRRVRYIPFDFTLKDQPEKKDKKLPEKLQAEASGILAWLVRGCLEWQREGLNPPPVVLDATGAYRDESDIFKLFLEEKCATGPQERAALGLLYLTYVNWCEDAGEKARLPKRRFREVLRERGFEYTRGFGADGGWGFKGIGLSGD